MAEGILSFSTSNSFTSLLKRNTKTKVHLVLQAMGGTLALTGVSIQFLDKIKNGEEHWSTPHAVVGKFLVDSKRQLNFWQNFQILGSISITFLILTSSSGWSAFFGLNLKNYIKLVNLKIIHVLVSLIAFTTGMLAICSGYLFKDWTIERDPGETRVWIARLTLITLLITIMAPLKSIFFQMKKKIIWEMILLNKYSI